MPTVKLLANERADLAVDLLLSYGWVAGASPGAVVERAILTADAMYDAMETAGMIDEVEIEPPETFHMMRDWAPLGALSFGCHIASRHLSATLVAETPEHAVWA